jgi:hypothetical protein
MVKMDDCKNRFDQSKCDTWIIEIFEVHREIILSTDKDITDWTYPHDCPGKANRICSSCKYFEKLNAAGEPSQ